MVPLGAITHLDLDPQIVLRAASNKKLQDVVIMGYDADGNEYFASSMASGPNVLWLMESMKKALFEAADAVLDK